MSWIQHNFVALIAMFFCLIVITDFVRGKDIRILHHVVKAEDSDGGIITVIVTVFVFAIAVAKLFKFF